ncbi:MAG: hypothetical protein DRJ38_08525 [Thermoprotei archaeon]|nr:MAG: hypothetical protein DRJ38_08525 [Thermoprotei archaeon]
MIAMLILIVGLLKFDSGKTSLTASLVKEARSRGVDAVAVKPVGAHNAWNQYDTVLKSFEMRVLVGSDAYRLWKASDQVEPIEVLSPFDILIVPPDSEKTGFDRYLDIVENLFSQAALARLTKIEEHSFKSKHYVIKDTLRETTRPLHRILTRLSRFLQAEEIEIEDLLQISYSSGMEIDKVLEYLLEKHELVIVESFNDAACPTSICLNADRVILVTPGKAYVYSGVEYKKVLESFSEIKGLNITTPEVVRLLKPILTTNLTPKPSNSLDEPKAEISRILDIALNVT